MCDLTFVFHALHNVRVSQFVEKNTDMQCFLAPRKCCCFMIFDHLWQFPKCKTHRFWSETALNLNVPVIIEVTQVELDNETMHACKKKKKSGLHLKITNRSRVLAIWIFLWKVCARLLFCILNSSKSHVLKVRRAVTCFTINIPAVVTLWSCYRVAEH